MWASLSLGMVRLCRTTTSVPKSRASDFVEHTDTQVALVTKPHFLAVDWDRLHQPCGRSLPIGRGSSVARALPRCSTKHSVASGIGFPAPFLRIAVLFSKRTSSTLEPLRLPSHSRSECSLSSFTCVSHPLTMSDQSSKTFSFVQEPSFWQELTSPRIKIARPKGRARTAQSSA
jgi:hypothetical protein